MILWSDEPTTFAGTILAKGGALGGNGGFVETSGHNQLTFTGNVDTRAPNGTAGTLLLDPRNVTIGNDSEATNSATFRAQADTFNRQSRNFAGPHCQYASQRQSS